MRRYYLGLRHGNMLIPDHEGDEYPSLEHARAEAEECAREIASERLKAGMPLGLAISSIEVYDERGELRCTVPFASVLQE